MRMWPFSVKKDSKDFEDRLKQLEIDVDELADAVASINDWRKRYNMSRVRQDKQPTPLPAEAKSLAGKSIAELRKNGS